MRTLLAGFGMIAAGYSEDPLMSMHYPFASHAQVLAQHPAFQWDSVIDPNPQALATAQKNWGIQYVATDPAELYTKDSIEIVVLACPPAGRLGILENLPGLKAAIIEKPLGLALQDAHELMTYCAERELVVEVNLLRRFDKTCQALASGALVEQIGKVQGGLVLYGNGLMNNGSHMVDLVRFLVGEVRFVQAVTTVPAFREGPFANDINLPFIVTTKDGVMVTFQPVVFDFFRENSLEIWGEKGRLGFVQEGLLQISYPCVANRALSGTKEIAFDQPALTETNLGHAFYEMYNNLSLFLAGQGKLKSPMSSAIRTEEVLAAVLQSAGKGGCVVGL